MSYFHFKRFSINELTKLPPNETEVERSIPYTITKKTDIETYKHYIYAFISEKMERIHITSSYKYVAIYSFLFKVVKLNKAGARFKNERYNILSKRTCLHIVYGNYDICMFNTSCSLRLKGSARTTLLYKIIFNLFILIFIFIG